jgi:hypothetical protein
MCRALRSLCGGKFLDLSFYRNDISLHITCELKNQLVELILEI